MTKNLKKYIFYETIRFYKLIKNGKLKNWQLVQNSIWIKMWIACKKKNCW